MIPDELAVQNKSKKERQYLQKHIAVLNADSAVKSAREKAKNTDSFLTLEAFWNGVKIDGYACRVTVGTMALLRVSKSRCLGYGDSEEPLSAFDIAEAVFLISDDKRNIAVSVANKKDLLEKAVKSFAKELDAQTASEQLIEYLARISDALKAPDEFNADGSVVQCDVQHDTFDDIDDSWSYDVDILAHEYGWSDEYILWELPLIRAVKLKEAIATRRSSNKKTRKRDTSAIDVLKALEKRSKELRILDHE